MAKRVYTIVEIVDDITGDTIDESVAIEVRFSLQGKEYELDTSKDGMERLTQALQPYVDAGREIHKSSKSSSKGRRSRAETATIRQWAALNGHKVYKGGKMPPSTIEAWERAQDHGR